MKILISGQFGLIGSSVADHLDHEDNSPDVAGYDLGTTPKAFSDFDYGAFIDCARYAHQCDQQEAWEIVIEHFKQRGSGRIILFSSIYGHKAPDFSIYDGTEIKETPLEYAIWKGGTEQAVRYLAQKLKPWNIQVNAIAPGGVRNDHSEAFLQEYERSGSVPMIEPKNLFPVADMLLHPDNAVNGQVITVDAGWSL